MKVHVIRMGPNHEDGEVCGVRLDRETALRHARGLVGGEKFDRGTVHEYGSRIRMSWVGEWLEVTVHDTDEPLTRDDG